MTALSDAARSHVASALREAPRGSRTATADRLAGLYGVSRSSVYRAAGVRGGRRSRQAKRPEYRDWVRAIVTLAARPPGLTFGDARRLLVEGGKLPPEAADMPLGTAYRLAKELDLQARAPRTHKLHADYPMQAVLIDWSSSKYLLVDKRDGDDWGLKLHQRPVPSSGYKNRPLGPERLRVGVYGLWDMCTGYVLARYYVERGESALGALEFLMWALGRDKDERLVLHGVPDDLWSDLGPLVRSEAAADLLKRLQIAVITGEAYSKSRMGGVENGHATRWRSFERTLFHRLPRDIPRWDRIRLSEVNDRLDEFLIRENTRLARVKVGGRDASRAAAWTALTNARPADNPLRRLPHSPMETLAREARRRVDVNGIVRWGGVLYECADWHDRWVVARRAADDSGDLALECETTGERRTARRYEPRAYGEVRSAPASPRDKVRAEHADLAVAVDLYAPKPAAAGNVRPMPVRSSPAAELENPLAADRLRDVDEAMRLFGSICPYALSAGNLRLLRARIEEAGLSRQAVTELAQEVSALMLKEG